MSRWIRLLIALALLPALLLAPVASAQNDDIPPQEPPDDLLIIPPPDEEMEPLPPAVDRVTQLLLDARIDLELLAGAMIADGSRPEGWTGAVGAEGIQLALGTRLDLELLAGTLLRGEAPPAGWFGTVSSTPYAVARDIRHDLELLADRFGRPEGWRGGEPLLRCDRSTQALVSFLERGSVFTLQADRTAPDFCRQATLEVSRFVEINYLADPDDGPLLVVPPASGAGGGSSAAQIDSRFAVAFFDRGAARRAGIIPDGTSFEPVARSAAQFSNMMLIRGDGFEVFVDYQFTTVTRAEFDTLPDVAGLEIAPACAASWCAR